MFLRRVTGFLYIAALAAVTLVLYVPVALVLVVSMIGDAPAKAGRAKSAETSFTIVESERRRTGYNVRQRESV